MRQTFRAAMIVCAALPFGFDAACQQLVEPNATPQTAQPTSTFSADVEQVMNMGSSSAGGETTAVVKGKMFVSQGRIAANTVSTIVMESLPSDDETALRMVTVLGSDGAQWNRVEEFGEVEIVKIKRSPKPNPSLMSSPAVPAHSEDIVTNIALLPALLATWYQFTDVAEGTVPPSGLRTVKGTLKSGALDLLDPDGDLADLGLQMETIQLRIDPNDGILREYLLLAKDGTPFIHLKVSNVEIDPPIDESMFRYIPPADADITEIDEEEL